MLIWRCILRHSKQSVVTVSIVISVSGILFRRLIMSLKSGIKLHHDEILFSNELGWFAALSVLVASFSPYIVDIFG